MASLALPTMFPPVLINREYFGDGALRQKAPLSAALHLGADKILVLGVAGQPVGREKVTIAPSVAQVMGQLIASAFIDSLSEDIEMLQRFNDFAECLTKEQLEKMRVKPIKLLVIEPTIKFGEVASRFISHLPNSTRLLLRITGANRSTGESNLASYILFEKEFCRGLIQQGYADAMAQADSIRAFMAD
jgi:NTE family protein